MDDSKIIIKNNFPQQYYHVVRRNIFFHIWWSQWWWLGENLWLTNNLFWFIENADFCVINRVNKQNEKPPGLIAIISTYVRVSDIEIKHYKAVTLAPYILDRVTLYV